MRVWMIARECAGIAEAGGVKNVVCSLVEQLTKKNHQVSLFIPEYGCTNYTNITNIIQEKFESKIKVQDKEYVILYKTGNFNGTKIIFICNQIFSEKKAVYTYVSEEEKLDSSHKAGQGHFDNTTMNILFQKAVLDFGVKFLTNNRNEFPEVIHCHDAATALIPVFAQEFSQYKQIYCNTKFLVSIHNAGPGYHHAFSSIDEAYSYTNLDKNVLTKGRNTDFIEPFFLASFYAKLCTVSPWYAYEIVNPSYQYTDGLSKLFARECMKIKGIVNGIDYDKYDPKDTKKSGLPFAFSPEDDDFDGKYKTRKLFLDKFSNNENNRILDNNINQYGYIDKVSDKTVFFAYHGRMVWQKGVDILADAAASLLESNEDNIDVRFIIIGHGQTELEELHIKNAQKFSGKYLYFKGYDRNLARLCICSGDFLVLPSRFEPCGLEDFIGTFYGTLPIAHSTGGLNKIIHEETGFLYNENNIKTLTIMLKGAASLITNNFSVYKNMQKMAFENVCTQYSWNNILNEYEKLYKEL